MGSVILTDDPGQSVRGFPIAWMIWWEKRRPLDPMEYRKKNSQKKTPAKIGRQNCDMRKEKHTAYIKLYGAGDLYLNKRFPKPTDKHRGHFMESGIASFPAHGKRNHCRMDPPAYDGIIPFTWLTLLSFWLIMESAKKIECAYMHEYPRTGTPGVFH